MQFCGAPTASSTPVRVRSALDLGATEAVALDDMEGVGRGGYLLDPDGNVFGLMSPVLSDGTVAMGV